MRNRFSRIRIFCSLSVVTVCAGCITGLSDLNTSAENYVDLSDPAAGKAQLRAARWDIGIAGIYCYMTAPAFAERVTVTAGSVDVSVVCETSDIGSNTTWVTEASFSFDALTGHDYVITERRCGGCVKLTDETTGEVVAAFPALSYSKGAGIEQDLSTGDDTATIKGFSSCRLSNRKIRSLVVDAGPIIIDVTCELHRLTIPFSKWITSSFAFNAEAGHTYTFIKIPFGEKCISLYDNTLKSTPIACEPYEKVD